MENLALYVLVALVVLSVGLNIGATFIVCRTYFEVKNRRRNQIIFVWLVPIIGSLLAIFINREDYFAQKHQTQVGNNPNISESEAVTFGVASNHNADK